MRKQHGLYKYVTCDTNEIIYIGKTNNSFKSRIDDHGRGNGIDEKFNAYKGNYKVYIAHLPNATETDIVERALINKYKPILNGTDNHNGFSGLIEVKEPEWKEYIPEENKTIMNTSTKKSKRDDWEEDHLLLGETPTSKVYITNTYTVREKGRKVKKLIFQDQEQALACIALLCDRCIRFGVVESDGIHDKDYKVSGYLFPDDIRERLIADDPCMFVGPLWLVKGKSTFSARHILCALQGEGENLKYAWFYKPSIDYLTTCLQYWNKTKITVEITA